MDKWTMTSRKLVTKYLKDNKVNDLDPVEYLWSELKGSV